MGENTSKKIITGSINVFDAILATIKGKLVPDEVKEERVSICNSCDKLIAVELGVSTRRCGLCECFVDWKASIPKEECPAGKWKTWSDGAQH